MKNFLRKHTIPIGIFLFFSGFYLLTTPGILASSDEIINFLTARALVEDQSFALEVDCQTFSIFVKMRPDGQCYGKYDVGLAFTGLPLYLLGRILDGPAPSDYNAFSLPRLIVSTLNQFVTAATCTVLYLLALELSASRKNALELSILFGLATIAWPYSGTFFSQPVIGFLLITAVLLLRKGKKPIYAFSTGVLLGWAILTRLDSIPLVCIILLYALYQFKTRTANRRDLLKNVLALAVPLILSVVLYLLFNLLRSGAILQNSYAGEGWTGNFLQGAYGLLFSPGRGIIFYSPLVILAVPGLWMLWQQGLKADVLLIVGLFLAQISIYAAWWAWEGGWVWGPRFLVSTLPLLMLGLLPWLERERYKILVISLVTIGFLVQVIAVTTSPVFYITTTHFSYDETLFIPAASPIIGHTKNLLLDKNVMYLMVSQAYGVLSRGQTILWGGIAVILMLFGGKLLTSFSNPDYSVSD